jgi:uncharacterized protein (DUF58 family)
MRWRPGDRFGPCCTAWAIVALAAIFWPWALWLFAASGLALVLAAGLDALALGRIGSVGVERDVAESLALGVWVDVALRFSPPPAASVGLEVFDLAPPAAEVAGLPARLRLQKPHGATLSYRLRPLRRGDLAFGRVDLLVGSPWGFWRRREQAGSVQKVRVLPNFQPVARYALLALEDRVGHMGIRFQRRRGEGMEFRELREFRDGDALRQIDWKATARWQKVISRQYEEERNQQILMVLDCGRRLRARDGDLTHFDHVLDAALLLGWVAIRQGDAVGLATVGGIDRFLAPQKGRAGLPALVRAVYDLEPTLEPADYQDVAARILSRQRRRALIVLLTNVRDEDADDLLPAIALLRERHLVLVASLRERALSEALEQPVQTFEAALEVAATHRYLEARALAHERLRGHGALVLDVEPARLAISAVNRYLEVKRAGRL